MLSHHRHAYSGIRILSPLIKLKNVVEVGPPLTKLSGSAHKFVLINHDISIIQYALLFGCYQTLSSSSISSPTDLKINIIVSESYAYEFQK